MNNDDADTLRRKNPLLEQALQAKSRQGLTAAINLLEKGGINRELAAVALLGGRQAVRHGYVDALWWQGER